ncbi:MAG: LLM class flavin-dependent oxidoreductase [Proteobacteria bacterium]|nr:LLM class flavin-dependent oxidoreductase [Pseudomonadota bacterium]
MKFGIFDHLDRSGPDAERQYEERLRLIELYEWAGFHAYHVAEHHGTPLGMAPSPGLFLSAVAQRTTTLRFGPLVYPLGLYQPLRLAEEICMLDQMSGGRLELGVGRGASPYEAAFFGVDPKTTAERFDEALGLVLKGLVTGRLDGRGKHFSFDNVPLEVTTVQRPHPPLWHVSRSLESAPRLAGEGCNVALSLPTAEAAAFCDAYRKAWVALERSPQDMPFLGNTRNVVVGDNDRETVAMAKRAFKVWYDSLVHLWRVHDLTLPKQIFPSEFEEAVAEGYVIAGSVPRVLEQMRADIGRTGINYALCRFAYGDLSFEESARSVRLFAREVMPELSPGQGNESNTRLPASVVDRIGNYGAETDLDIAFPFR